jgi:hypothetical protein
MSLATWFKSNRDPLKASARLAAITRNVIDYIAAHSDQEQFFPQILATALGESELAVLAALQVLDEKGVVRPRYGLYCARDSAPIEIYDSRSEIPSEANCEICDRELNLDEETMYVELFFVVDRSALKREERNAA